MPGGFLGYNASFMLDVVVCALLLVVPTIIVSIYLVKCRKQFYWHRNLQLILGGVLLVTVILFEVDLQIVHGGWENIVINAHKASPLSDAAMNQVRTVLRVHLFFAISTPVLWVVTIGYALKKFPNPPHPNEHSRLHKTLGWLSTLDITLTAITGLIFYYFAFIA